MMTPDPEGDQLLVQLAQQGDSDAFGLLVTRYQAQVMRLASRLVQNVADAEDVTQETFIKAFRSLNSFRGDALFSTWIYRIAINVAKTHWRGSAKSTPQQALVDLDLDPDVGGIADTLVDADTPESLLERKQLERLVISGIEELPADLRTALTLREIEGMSYDEISTIMECPVGTVRSRIFRAREIIAQYIAR